MRVLFCNWRDTRNPEGGGSERYVEAMARGLVARGHTVTIACAEHGRAPRDEVVDRVRFVRRGSKMGVYLQVLLGLLLRRYGNVDLVVDVQNGLPFFTRLVTRKPVMLLVHHVHREQWPVVYPGLIGKVGWWIERWLSPRLYRHSQYVTVSSASRDELVALGVDAERIAIVHNGSDPAPLVASGRSPEPRVVVVGRLVPHKQVEHAVDALATHLPDYPGAHLDIVGDGWWYDDLVAHVADLGITDNVTFHGFIAEQAKHELLASAWVMALPSLKEGWGIVIGEAGAHATPTVAYRSAGGPRESIADGVSGLLVDTPEEFIAAVRHLIDDDEERKRLGAGALAMSHQFSWENATRHFADLVELVGFDVTHAVAPAR